MFPEKDFFIKTNSVRAFLLALVLILSSSSQLYSQHLPVGYITYYSQKGNQPDFLKTLVIKPTSGIVINKEKTFAVLKPMVNDSVSQMLTPFCRGIIADKIFGEYIIEFEYKIQPGLLDNSAGFCFLGPVKSDNTYYTTIFSNDTIAFLYFDEGTIIKNETAASNSIRIGWNKVKIQRDILGRKLEITLNNNIKDIITFTDRDLVMGFVGFGTQNVTSCIRNINIWAPTAFSDTLYHGE